MPVPRGRQAAAVSVRPRRRRQLGIVQAMVLVVSVTAGEVLTAGLLVTVTDPVTFPHLGTGVWWAATTITTVGYGDVVPVSGAGRVVAGVLMFSGIAALAFVTAIAASSIVVGEVEQEEHEVEAHERRVALRLAEIDARLARIERALAEPGAQDPPHRHGLTG